MYRYIGDDWLELHDSMNSMDMVEQLTVNDHLNHSLIRPSELAFMTGGDKVLRRSIEYLMGVNRVLHSDPEKYTKIFSGKDKRYPQVRTMPISLLGDHVKPKHIRNDPNYIN